MPASTLFLLPLLLLAPTVGMLAFSETARADVNADCGWDGDHIDYNCDNGYGGGAAGASAPVIGDTLEGNPAALPTEDTPFGLEGSYDNRAWPDGSSKFEYSTVKGFDGIGFGIGSWGDGQFSAPDFDNHFYGTVSDSSYRTYVAHPPSTLGLRLGTAVVLPKFIFGRHLRVSVGGSAGLGRVTGDWSPQVGVLVKFFGLGFGASNSYEHISLLLPRVTVTTLSVGAQLGPIYLGYAHQMLKSASNSTNANIVGARLSFKKWVLYGNVKSQIDYRGMPDAWTDAGIQRRLGRRIGIGYEYGRYRYSHTAILQIYL